MRSYAADFPALSPHGHRAPVYLDAACSTPMPAPVLEAMADFCRQNGMPPYAARHSPGRRATLAFERARADVAALCGALSPGQIVLTQNATEAINLVCFCYAALVLEEGDAVAATSLEHHANYVPWMRAAKAAGAQFTPIPCGEDGLIRGEDIDRCIHSRTKIVALSSVSHLTGLPLPRRRIIRRAKEVGAVVLLDACLDMMHSGVDFHALDVDFGVFSSPKMYGPAGVGALYAKPALLEAMPPFLAGGGSVASLTPEEVTFAPPPARFEAGGRSTEAALGFGAAARYLAAVDREEAQAHTDALVAQTLAGMAGIPGLEVLGPADAPRQGIVAFVVKGFSSADVLARLEASGLSIGAGTLCAQPQLERMGLPGCCRVSFGLYSTGRDVEALLDALRALPHPAL